MRGSVGELPTEPGRGSLSECRTQASSKSQAQAGEPACLHGGGGTRLNC